MTVLGFSVVDSLLDVGLHRVYDTVRPQTRSHTMMKRTDYGQSVMQNAEPLEDSPQEGTVDRVTCFREVDIAHVQRHPLSLSHSLHSEYQEHHVDGRASPPEATLFFWHYPVRPRDGLSGGGRYHLEEHFIGMGHEGDTPEISASSPIFLLEQYNTVMVASFHFCGTPPAF